MPEVEELMFFTTHLVSQPSQDDLRDALTVGILSVTLILFTHTIYILITHKFVRRLFRRKPQREVPTTPTILERVTHPQERIPLSSLLLSLSHCYTLRGDFYLNTTHTYSECREPFRTWEGLGICQNKPVRLGSAIR